MRWPSMSMNPGVDAARLRSGANTVLGLAAAFAAGALVMYLMDPAAGRRRRALMRDKGMAMGHNAQHFVHAKTKRASDRVRGVVAKTRAHLSHEPIEDERLHDRIRSKMGRLVSHPHAIHVDVHYGRVVLKGTASRDEADELVSMIESMRGVEGVHDLLVTEEQRPPQQQLEGGEQQELRH